MILQRKVCPFGTFSVPILAYTTVELGPIKTPTLIHTHPHCSNNVFQRPYCNLRNMGECGGFILKPQHSPTLSQIGSFWAGEHSWTVWGFSENPHTEQKSILRDRGAFWDSVGVFWDFLLSSLWHIDGFLRILAKSEKTLQRSFFAKRHSLLLIH